MTEPFLGQISMYAFAFPPRGWALCNGATLLINQNQALFALLGTAFGGDGQTRFALPDLRGRAPVHVDAAHRQGSAGGAAEHTLSAQEMPQHVHTLAASAEAGGSQSAGGNVLARASSAVYEASAGDVVMNAASLQPAGGSQPHPNMQPSTVLSFCIALQGIFPSPN